MSSLNPDSDFQKELRRIKAKMSDPKSSYNRLRLLDQLHDNMPIIEPPGPDFARNPKGEYRRANRYPPPLPSPLVFTAFPEQPNYRLQWTVSKGFGLFATKLIPVGTRILTEAPLISDPKHLDNFQEKLFELLDLVLELDGEDLAKFVTLAANERSVNLTAEYFDKYWRQPDPPLKDAENSLWISTVAEGVYSTNAHAGGIYTRGSRINHSCTPNCDFNVVDTATGQSIPAGESVSLKGEGELRVHAVRDISPGEELTKTYCAQIIFRQAGKFKYLGHWGFVCHCEVCVFAPGRDTEYTRWKGRNYHEVNRELIRRLNNDIEFLNIRLLHVEHHLHTPFLSTPLYPLPHGPLAASVLSPSPNQDAHLEATLSALWDLLTSPIKEGNLRIYETVGIFSQGQMLSFSIFLRARTADNARRVYMWASKLTERVKMLRGTESEDFVDAMAQQLMEMECMRELVFGGVWGKNKDEDQENGGGGEAWARPTKGKGVGQAKTKAEQEN